MADTKSEEKKSKPLVERASTVPALDLAFGYYWEARVSRRSGTPSWGSPRSFGAR
jgi:hypothetical protein